MRKLVIHWEWVAYGALLPVLLFPSGWRALALVGLPLLWLLRGAVTREFFPRTPLNGAILLMALALLLSLYATFDMALSFSKIAGLVLGISLFFTAVFFIYHHRYGVGYVTAATLLAGVGMVIVGAAGTTWTGVLAPLNQIQQFVPFSASDLPGTTAGVNVNQLAGVIVWVAPLALGLGLGLLPYIWRAAGIWRKLFWLATLSTLAGITAPCVLLLLATQSRGGLMAFALALLLMLVMAGKWGRLLAATAVVLVIAFVLGAGLDRQIIQSITAEGSADFGLGGRLEIWSRAIYALQDFPFTGVSMNGFRRVVPILYPLFLVSPDTDIAHAHNHLLQAGLDLGIPGLVAYLALWLLGGWLVWQGWRQPSSVAMRALAIGLAGALAGGWFFGVLDAIALGARPSFLWWLLLALAVALVQPQQREPDNLTG